MRIVVLNQAFPPDVVSSAQHVGDLARRLSDLGHAVTVIASRRAYDNPSQQFPAREEWQGVQVIRIRCTAFGKAARWRRAFDFGTFLGSCLFQLLPLRRPDVIIAMTSPPLISFLGAMFARLRSARLILWMMDVNPDEAIAAGWLQRESLPARVLEWCLRQSLRCADQVVALDRFMKRRLDAKTVSGAKPLSVSVIPPWSHDRTVTYDIDGRERFRRLHGIAGKFVVMYSGNHSPCHPLQTLLDAARRVAHRSDIVFCFVGGGSEHNKVKRFADDNALRNIICLPYQPLEQLSASLSAADLHVVLMGDAFVGIVHPCKVYNVLRLGIPFLYIGPPESHVMDLVADGQHEWSTGARHGDVAAVVDQIVAAAASHPPRSGAAVSLSERFSQDRLMNQFVHLIEGGAQQDAVEAYAGR